MDSDPWIEPVASYVKYFEVPERMKGKRLFSILPGSRERAGSVAEWQLYQLQ